MSLFLRRLLLFSCVLACVSGGLDAWLMHGLRARRSGALGTWNQVMAGRVNASVLFTGSSRCLVDVDAPAIERITGRRTFNMGMEGTQLNLQLALLRSYFKHDRAPQLLLQEVDMISLSPDSDLYEPSQYAPYMHERAVAKAVQAVDPDRWKDHWIPLYGFVRNGLPLVKSAVAGALGREDTTHVRAQGFERRDLAWDSTFDHFAAEHPQGIRRGLSPRSIADLKEIVRLGREHGAQVVLFYAPELKEMQALTQDRATFIATFQQVATEMQVPFWDFSDAAMCGERRWFYNSQHLTGAGVDRFTPMLADSVRVLLR